MWENASVAPSRCMACAMPQAMERSVASPTIRARLPFRKPIVSPNMRLLSTEPVASLALLPTGFDVHDQPLPGSDLVVLVQAVPALELR